MPFVDFGKRLEQEEPEKLIDPNEIYEQLDRASDVSKLRGSQRRVLEDWYDNRRDCKNNVVKLHTGEGKTLVGLLMLQSKLNELKKPCVYVCSNIYLVNQVVREAKRFGIHVCQCTQGGAIPNEFYDGSRILVVHVQKLFNGLTKLGLGKESQEIGAIVLDDSHACIDSIKSSVSFNIKAPSNLYKELLELFSESLREQGEGTFLDIKNGRGRGVLPVPYWDWFDKLSEATELIAEYRNEKAIMRL